MISIYSVHDIAAMKQSGAIVAKCMEKIEGHIHPGITTAELDTIAYRYIKSQNAEPSCLGYQGYPATICASINEEVVHGIPGDRALCDGDIVAIDIVVFFNGFHSDMTRTFLVGDVSEEKRKLVADTQHCFEIALDQCYPGKRTGDIGYAVQSFAESLGYGVVRAFCGHGCGRSMHEEPEIPNFGRRGKGEILKPGMILAIEPMINLGTDRIKILSNGWTAVTVDGKPSAHYENTVAITETGPLILTSV